VAQVENIGQMGLAEKPVPEPSHDSLLVKVEACAICGSDVRIFRKGDARAKYPRVIGHEIAGVAVKVGKNVAGIKAGDRVCVAPGHGCGECRYCRTGHSNVCINPCPSVGYASDGGFAEYMVPPPNVVRLGFVNKIPAGLSFDHAAMSELLACCLNAQENTPVREGDVVLVIGAGPAGCMMIDLARLQGAHRVLLTQRSRGRLDLAARFAPDRTICSGEENLAEAVMKATDGLGADVIFVCAPSKEAQEQALELAAPRGRINFFGGLPKDNCRITTNANAIHYKELFLGGASSSLARQNQKALELLADRKVSAEKYITHTFPLRDIVRGFEAVENRQAIKVVIKPGAST
ncbi:MAG: alcohol dehydrogenase catalytic domain-containing protein, partial [Kiritimatiellaeota bacterium]|nr:alcohol dehydrogenase catalytic domain-containing protein [Kiritimatiellota bacterium]